MKIKLDISWEYLHKVSFLWALGRDESIECLWMTIEKSEIIFIGLAHNMVDIAQK